MATALEHLGGVEALVLGGCCELNSTAQALITEIGTQLGHLAAANLGDGLGECVALSKFTGSGSGWPPESGAAIKTM